MVSWTILLVTLAGCSLAGSGANANGSSHDDASGPRELGIGPQNPADSSNESNGVGTAVSNRDREIAYSLKEGGYVILLRHLATNGPRDQGSASDEDTSQNRVQETSEAIRKLSIPVGQVLSSPDSPAQRASAYGSGHTQIETTEVLRLQDPSDVQSLDELDAKLRQLLSTAPSSGENTILISTVPESEGLEETEAETVVFKPLGSSNFQRVALITPEQWTELARSTG